MGEIVVNGEARPVDGPLPLLELIEKMGLGVRWVIVERNRRPVYREDYATTILQPGDRVEIGTPMAGG